MLQAEKQKIFLLQLSLVIFILQVFDLSTIAANAKATRITPPTITPQKHYEYQPSSSYNRYGRVNAAENVLNLLSKIESSNEIDANTKFALLLGEFIIKQKVRFFESTRYEEQMYYHILQKLNAIIQLANNVQFEEIQRKILDNIFQKDVLLIPPSMKQGHIDTHLEYKSLLQNYDQLADTGEPNATLSDACLAAIATLDNTCNLCGKCLDNAITSDLPTYGYHRMHQILLLYVFMHHKCATNFGSQAAYEILASQKCTQAYREQNVIKERAIPLEYRDLYLEQIAVCGLFGYVEFLNWHNLELIASWENNNNENNYNNNGCYCLAQDIRYCNCSHKNDHMSGLKLVYYINALLLLE